MASRRHVGRRKTPGVQLPRNAVDGGEKAKAICNAERVDEFDPKRMEGGGIRCTILVEAGMGEGTESSSLTETDRQIYRLYLFHSFNLDGQFRPSQGQMHCSLHRLHWKPPAESSCSVKSCDCHVIVM